MNDEAVNNLAMSMAVTMGYDAMRIAVGKDPETHTREDVAKWIAKMNEISED